MGSLADYVRGMRASGYRSEDIRARLIAQGYASVDVESALSASQKVGRYVWVAVGICIIGGIISLIALFS